VSHEQADTDVSRATISRQVDVQGAVDSGNVRDTRGSEAGAGRDTKDSRERGSERPDEMLPDVVGSKQYKALNKKYRGLLEIHAIFMLDTMTRSEIADDLAIGYEFHISADGVKDLREALNVEQAFRRRLQKRLIE